MWLTRFGRLRESLPRIDAELEELKGLKADVLRLVEGSVAESSLPVTDPAVVNQLTAMATAMLEHSAEIQRLRDLVKTLEIALAEGIEHEERRERRIRATVARSRKQLEDRDLRDPALDAEYEALPQGDGDSGPGEGVQLVPDDLADDGEDHPSSIPGVSAFELQRARGLI